MTNTTQQQLADIAGVSRSAVSLWEIGKAEPRMGAVQAMADHFGLRKANIIEDGGMDGIAASVTGRLYAVEYDTSRLTDDERHLLDLYRACTPQGREYLLHHFSPCRHVPQHALAALLRAPRAAGCTVSPHLGRAWDTKKRPPPPKR